MRKLNMPGPQPSYFSGPQVGKRKSFDKIEGKAREVLRERGLSEAQIEDELHRSRREQDD